jgi:hypothetical protein
LEKTRSTAPVLLVLTQIALFPKLEPIPNSPPSTLMVGSGLRLAMSRVYHRTRLRRPAHKLPPAVRSETLERAARS